MPPTNDREVLVEIRDKVNAQLAQAPKAVADGQTDAIGKLRKVASKIDPLTTAVDPMHGDKPFTGQQRANVEKLLGELRGLTGDFGTGGAIVGSTEVGIGDMTGDVHGQEPVTKK